MVHVLLCTDRQAQDRSFHQSRPHNPSLKHRNRQGNHWHSRLSKEEGNVVLTQLVLTREPRLEPLGQHVTTQNHARHNRARDSTHSGHMPIHLHTWIASVAQG
jgi:hypothetical protein